MSTKNTFYKKNCSFEFFIQESVGLCITSVKYSLPSVSLCVQQIAYRVFYFFRSSILSLSVAMFSYSLPSVPRQRSPPVCVSLSRVPPSRERLDANGGGALEGSDAGGGNVGGDSEDVGRCGNGPRAREDAGDGFTHRWPRFHHGLPPCRERVMVELGLKVLGID